MDKIVSVDKPKEKKSRWALFVIHYENKNGEKYDAHVFEEEYNVRMFKDYLLKKGISEVDLDRYEELLYKYFGQQLKLSL